jgi:hypothetical protein
MGTTGKNIVNAWWSKGSKAKGPTGKREGKSVSNCYYNDTY